MPRSFTITEEHLKLLKNMYVGWQDAMAGAPCVDVKRPYGSRDYLGDIHRILTGSETDRNATIVYERYDQLHRETETVLQIILRTSSVLCGTYVADDYKHNWSLVTADKSRNH